MSRPAVDHDHAPAIHDRDATAQPDVLRRLRVNGAIFLVGQYSEKWAYESVPVEDIAAMLIPGAERVVLFHVIESGRCWIATEDGEKHWAKGGDVIVLPYGDGHRMGGVADTSVLAAAATLVDAPPWDRLPVIDYGEGGAKTRVLCGYMLCDDPLFDPRMRALPPVFVVSLSGTARTWVKASIEYALHQMTLVGDERFEMPPDVPQMLLTEVLKLHLASAPASEQGLAAALRDPIVGPAIALIHDAPERKWTVADLAASVNVSVSRLDERFRDLVGGPPIRYLTGWRMHVAQDLLASTDLGVAVIARRVGYESEEAFSRAFKRSHGESPSIWRQAKG